MDDQLDMFVPNVPVLVSVDIESKDPRERFKEFHRRNPAVYLVAVQLARRLKLRGMKKCGISMIFERMRWLHALQTNGDDFKLNNTFRAFYARLIMANNNDLAEFFELRRSMADEEEINGNSDK